MRTVPSLASCTTAGMSPFASSLSDLYIFIFSCPNGDSFQLEVPLQILDSELLSVKKRGGERRMSAPFHKSLQKVLLRACSAGSDDGDPDTAAKLFQKIQVITGLGAVAVHTRQKNLSRSELLGFLGPRDRIKASIFATPVYVNVPPASVNAPLGIDRDDDTLGAKPVGAFCDDSRALDRHGIQGHFIRTRLK